MNKLFKEEFRILSCPVCEVSNEVNMKNDDLFVYVKEIEFHEKGFYYTDM